MSPRTKIIPNQPAAPAENTVCFGRARFQFMTSRLVRMEWAEDSCFEDRPTLAVVNRQFDPVDFQAETHGQTLTLKTDSLTLTYTDDGKRFCKDNLSVVFELDGERVLWDPASPQTGNLGSTLRTLDGVNGNYKNERVSNPDYLENKLGKGQCGEPGQSFTEFTRMPVPVDLGIGLLSRDGWALIDDSANVVLAPVQGQQWVQERPAGTRQDLYLLAYGHDYKAALADGAEIFGRQPLPPRYAFGYWWSRYWAYSDEEIEGLVDSFDAMKVPMDVMVIDMDWHLEGWTGYTWDRRYFPDADEFLAEMKNRNMKVTLNLHPADGVGRHEEQFETMAQAMGVDSQTADKVEFNITDPNYMNAYFEHLHHPDERRGVDFWWMDWQQGETTAMKGLDTLPWINHLHWQDMADNPDRGDKRPLIFSRYGGVGAGRYCIGFSGDTHSTWDSLAYQPYFTATASNVLYGYWSHDIGGHMPGEIEPELYTRWMQYGMYSPVLRTHTTKNPDAERRVWEYPDPYNQIMMDVIRQRYELVPYIYSESRQAFDNGISLCRPMYYDYPEQEAAYRARNQYMFGDQMLVAPVISPADAASETAQVCVWLPEGEWFDTARGCLEQGGQTITRRYLINEVPVFVRPGAVIPGQRHAMRLDDASIRDLLVTIYGGDQGEYTLYEDDGSTVGYQNNVCAEIHLSHTRADGVRQIRIAPVRGTYEGFAAEKSLEIRLAGTVPPSAIKLGDAELGWAFRLGDEGWTYDGRTATTIIRLARRDLSAGLTLDVVENAELANSLSDGLKGMLARLKRANYYNTMATSGHILHQDERLGIELAQAGNRISRAPQRFAAEVKTLRADINQLRTMLAELSQAKSRWEAQTACGPNPTRYRNCQKALALLSDLP
jgi:alpha-glucosidase